MKLNKTKHWMIAAAHPMDGRWTFTKGFGHGARTQLQDFGPDAGRNDAMRFQKALHSLMRPYWRLTRGLTLGAQAIVMDDDERVLLVRHRYQSGWHLPGGGVEWNETVHSALARELAEEAGIRLCEPPRLHGIFAHHAQFPGDHICVFIVRSWRRDDEAPQSLEISERRFFALGELPEDTAKGARRRLAEVFEGRPLDMVW